MLSKAGDKILQPFVMKEKEKRERNGGEEMVASVELLVVVVAFCPFSCSPGGESSDGGDVEGNEGGGGAR